MPDRSSNSNVAALSDAIRTRGSSTREWAVSWLVRERGMSQKDAVKVIGEAVSRSALSDRDGVLMALRNPQPSVRARNSNPRGSSKMASKSHKKHSSKKSSKSAVLSQDQLKALEEGRKKLAALQGGKTAPAIISSTSAKKASVKKASSKKKASVKKASAKKASAKRASVKKASVKKASVKRASVKKASAKKASVKRASVKRASVKKTSAKKAPTWGQMLAAKKKSSRKASKKRRSAKRRSVKRASAKRASTRKATRRSAKRRSVKRASTRKASRKSAKRRSAKRASVKRASVRKASSRKAAARKAAPKKSSRRPHSKAARKGKKKMAKQLSQNQLAALAEGRAARAAKAASTPKARAKKSSGKKRSAKKHSAKTASRRKIAKKTSAVKSLQRALKLLAPKPHKARKGRKPGKAAMHKVPTGKYTNKQGAQIVIRRSYSQNPTYDIKDLAAGAGGLFLGVILADFSDRFVATRKPKDATAALTGDAAAAAIRASADGYRLATQGGATALLGVGAYLLRDRSPMAAFGVGGAAVAFGGKFLTMLVTDVLMPRIFKASTDATKPAIGDRFYPDKQIPVASGTAALPYGFRRPGYQGLPGFLGAPQKGHSPFEGAPADVGPVATGAVGCGACGSTPGAAAGQFGNLNMSEIFPSAKSGCPTCSRCSQSPAMKGKHTCSSCQRPTDQLEIVAPPVAPPSQVSPDRTMPPTRVPRPADPSCPPCPPCPQNPPVRDWQVPDVRIVPPRNSNSGNAAPGGSIAQVQGQAEVAVSGRGFASLADLMAYARPATKKAPKIY